MDKRDGCDDKSVAGIAGGNQMKIVVLAGGISPERDVSLCSGKMIYQALCRRGHQALLLDVYLGYEGDLTDIFETSRELTAETGTINDKNPDLDQIRAMRPDGEKNFFGPHVIALCQQADIVFLALHGENGENGKIQAAFDLMGIKYTGADYVSSALAMNKTLAKELFFQNGIPTPQGFALKQGEEEKEAVTFPCVVKVCSGGSSVGVYLCGNEQEYQAAKKEAYTYEREILVEQYIRGREFSVGVIEGKALPVIEIAPLQGFYDYKNKYQPGSTIETCPAEIPAETEEKMGRAAEAVFRALRLKAYARVDFMMNEKGEIFCLEANTLPGMTPTSLLPQEAQAAGMDFESLCEHLIEVSLRKQ